MSRLQSLKEFVFGKKESRTSSIIRAPGSGGTVWPERNYENFSRETYLKNSTAFTAIREVGRSAASVPWAHYRRLNDDKRELLTDTAIAKTLKRPNPNESLEAIMLAAVSYIAMSGNAFFEKVMPETGPNKEDIQELYTQRPDRFKLEISDETGLLAGYEYEVDGRKVNWEVDPISGQCDILHLKEWHPLDDWWGAAATESTAREIDTSNAATQWNKALLDNQGRPGMVYTLVGQAGAEQMDEYEDYLKSRSGPANAGKDIIITGERGTGVSPYGWSPADLDFNEGDLRLMRKISMGYGVPPMLIGIPGEATFANFKEANLAFWERTVLWYLNYIKGELNNWLHEKDDDMFVDYILDDVPALAVKRDMLWTRAQESDFLTINQKLEMVGQESRGPEGDVVLVSASMVPLGMIGTEETEETVEEEEEKARQELLNEGYTEDEVDEMFGLIENKDVE